MQFPFSLENFLNVFKNYNESIFPLQIIFYLVAFISIYFLFNRKESGNKFIASALSFYWLWIGIVYHIIFFSTINKAAYIFWILFIVQGVLFAFYGVIKDSLSFEYQKSAFNYIGIIFIAYALIIYPVLGHLFGHRYPYSPTFGLPCPTTIFTFGILLFTSRKISIPFPPGSMQTGMVMMFLVPRLRGIITSQLKTVMPEKMKCWTAANCSPVF